jgi:hypothetical protein
MAKLPALVKAIQEVDGRDKKTLDHIARVVREAGYIPTGKRGSGSAEMTFEAAANYLIALNNIAPPKQLPDAIEHMRGLKRQICTGGAVSLFKEIDQAPDFGSALEATIKGFPQWWDYGQHIIEAEAKVEGWSEQEQLEKQQLLGAGRGIMALRIKFTNVNAEISFENEVKLEHDAMNNEIKKLATWVYLQPVANSEAWQQTYATEYVDRQVTFKVGLPTVAAIWSTISGQHNPAKEAVERLGEIKL